MDLWDTALDGIADDFERYCPGLAPIAVNQIDPDGGSATASVQNVPALKRVRHRQPQRVSSGELGQDECRFVFRADRLPFTLKAHDEILDANGLTWIIESVRLTGFGQLATADVVKKRP